MLPPLERYETQPPHRRVASVALGVTAYLDEPLHWARGGARRLLEAFLERVPRERLTTYTTSMLADYRTIRPHEVEVLAQGLSVPDQVRPRHQFQFRLADAPGAPELGFAYREVDRRLDRTGVLQIVLPRSSDPATLRALVEHLADEPVHCAIAGYQLSYREVDRPTAFWWGYEWARRFVGVDLQDADALAWEAHRGLPGTNWLTLVGTPFLRRWNVPLGECVGRLNDASYTEHLGGALFQAGPEPTLGDLNQLTYPYVYREVAHALQPYLLATPPEYLGGFYRHQATQAWMHRFIDPESWK
ncbi:MAG: type VI immunity family protein [Myxococcota bacterium]